MTIIDRPAQQAPPHRLAYGYEEAGALLGISYGMIRKLIAAGELRTISIGRRKLIPIAEIQRVASEGA